MVDPAGKLDQLLDLEVAGGKIRAIQHPGQRASPDCEVIDVAGLTVCPGFIDLHAHLRYPGFPAKETMATGTAAAAAGGFTTVCAMANTEPPVDSPAGLHDVQAEAKREAVVRVRQIAAISHRLQGLELTDFSALMDAGAVAFSDDGKPVWNETVMRRALKQSQDLGCHLSVHEEEPTVVGSGTAHAGERSRRLGLHPWPCEGEVAMVKRDVHLLEEVGGKLHIAHVSCRETVDVIREARQRGLAVTAEATPHHLCLTDALLDGDAELNLAPADGRAKVNPPLRSEIDRAALVAGVADGTIEAIATDHAPHTDADKAIPFNQAAFGFSAFETALPLLLQLVRSKYLTLNTLIERLTSGPAKLFDIPGGSLQVGTPADVCVFDPEKRWRLERDRIRSLGTNTPLLGAQLTGLVVLTLVGGQPVHRESFP